MSPLTPEQQELLFEVCMGLASPEQATQAESLIAANTQAAELHRRFRNTLTPLDTVDLPVCPDELVEGTLWRLKNADADGRQKLDELLAGEQARVEAAGGSFWGDMGRRLATAAVFVIVGSLMITTFKVINGYARQNAHRQMCAANLGHISQGITNYTKDHDGQMPAMMTSANGPWWMLGDQSADKDRSITRHLWVMVKRNYIDLDSCLCPGGQMPGERIDPCLVKDYYDFPSRAHINYSLQIPCSQTVKGRVRYRMILLADANPMFETMPADYSKPLRWSLDESLLNVNSINHRRTGQSLLYGDGHTEFSRTRFVGSSGDDIYTLENTRVYQGCERPTSPDDTFCAP